MATLGQFARNMRARAKSVTTEVRELKRVVAANVLQGVVTATPIDTGQARYNWNVAFNAPDYSTDMTGFRTYMRRTDWALKMSASVMTLARANERDVIYISNALPYIQRLNEGWSSQAPAGYVKIAALIAARSIAERRIIR